MWSVTTINEDVDNKIQEKRRGITIKKTHRTHSRTKASVESSRCRETKRREEKKIYREEEKKYKWIKNHTFSFSRLHRTANIHIWSTGKKASYIHMHKKAHKQTHTHIHSQTNVCGEHTIFFMLCYKIHFHLLEYQLSVRSFKMFGMYTLFYTQKNIESTVLLAPCTTQSSSKAILCSHRDRRSISTFSFVLASFCAEMFLLFLRKSAHKSSWQTLATFYLAERK
jgi:uncharacterized membrane protein YeiB